MAHQVPAKKGVWQEFRDFINKGDFITIAVGLLLALYIKEIVDSIIRGILTPIIAAIFGKPDLFDIGFDIGDSRINIGLVINAITQFIVIAFLLFLIIKLWNKLRGASEEGGDTELSVLQEIREELRTRNS